MTACGDKATDLSPEEFKCVSCRICLLDDGESHLLQCQDRRRTVSQVDGLIKVNRRRLATFLTVKVLICRRLWN